MRVGKNIFDGEGIVPKFKVCWQHRGWIKSLKVVSQTTWHQSKLRTQTNFVRFGSNAEYEVEI